MATLIWQREMRDRRRCEAGYWTDKRELAALYPVTWQGECKREHKDPENGVGHGFDIKIQRRRGNKINHI